MVVNTNIVVFREVFIGVKLWWLEKEDKNRKKNEKGRKDKKKTNRKKEAEDGNQSHQNKHENHRNNQNRKGSNLCDLFRQFFKVCFLSSVRFRCVDNEERVFFRGIEMGGGGGGRGRGRGGQRSRGGRATAGRVCVNNNVILITVVAIVVVGKSASEERQNKAHQHNIIRHNTNKKQGKVAHDRRNRTENAKHRESEGERKRADGEGGKEERADITGVGKHVGSSRRFGSAPQNPLEPNTEKRTVNNQPKDHQRFTRVGDFKVKSAGPLRDTHGHPDSEKQGPSDCSS